MRLGVARHSVAALALLLPVLSYAGQSESGPIDLPCGEPLPALRNGLFNLSLGPTRLLDGKSCLKLLPESPGCDWRVELTRAEKWGPADQLLLVVLNANHETGSGATDSVFLYACQRGTSVPVFSRRYLYGATVAMGQNSDLWITSGVWRPADPQCCPSRERREHYTWNKAKRRIVLAGRRITRVRRM